MAGDAFQKLGDSMSRAITKISVKTSSTLEKSKIKLHIETLTKDVQRMYGDVGEGIYSLWLNGDLSAQPLVEKLEAIKQKNDEIEQLTQELSSIDDRDNEIFGTKPEEAQKTEPETVAATHCPGCGAECEATAKFCRKCGYKLQ